MIKFAGIGPGQIGSSDFVVYVQKILLQPIVVIAGELKIAIEVGYILILGNGTSSGRTEFITEVFENYPVRTLLYVIAFEIIILKILTRVKVKEIAKLVYWKSPNFSSVSGIDIRPNGIDSSDVNFPVRARNLVILILIIMVGLLPFGLFAYFVAATLDNFFS